MQNKQKYNLVFLFICLACTITPCAYSSKSHDSKNEKFDRNQNMLINLKSAPMSAGGYLARSYSICKQMSLDLDRALNQIVEVDKAYAKSRHKPDNRYLESVCAKVTTAKQTADQLKEQVKDAFAELESSIRDTLVTDTKYN